MKQLFILFFAVSLLAVSCDDKTTESKKESADSTAAEKTSAGSETATVSVTDEKGDTIKLTTIPDGKNWVAAYQKMVTDDKQVSLRQIPNMIWLSASYLNFHMRERNKMKLCLAVNPNDNKIVVLLQTRKPGTPGNPSTFEYRLLQQASTARGDLNAFCPVPYPCAEPIEE